MNSNFYLHDKDKTEKKFLVRIIIFDEFISK